MTDLRQWALMLEQRVGGAFVENGLAVHIVGTVQGPHTWTVGLRLYEPTAGNIRKALKLAPAIEAAIGDGPVRVYSDKGLILVEVPSPSAVTIRARALEGQGLAVPIGLTPRRGVAGIDFERDPHLLVVGPTGRGKTTAMRAIAYHLARQNGPRRLLFAAITFKPGDWRAFDGVANCRGVIVDPGQAEAIILETRATMHERAAQGKNTPHLVLFLDDLLNLLAVADVTQALTEIASLGRAAGVHLVVGTQRLGKRGAGDAAITGNMPVRLVFGTASAQDAAQFTGRGGSGAEALGRYPGDALLVHPGGTRRLAVALVEDADVKALAGGAPVTGATQSPQNWPAPPPSTGGASPVRTGAGPVPGGAAVVRGGAGPVTPPRPLLEGPPRRPQDVELIRQVYRQVGSKNKAAIAIWGYKNSEVWQWLTQALGPG